MPDDSKIDEVKKKLSEVRSFIETDIKREIKLAEISRTEDGKAGLKKLGIEAGGGNFMAALALLCYTEFAGKFITTENNADTFNAFFKKLGRGYETLLKRNNKIYDTFRNGMAHQYYIKGKSAISMLKNGDTMGIVEIKSGQYWFNVETYLEDFLNAFDREIIRKIETEKTLFDNAYNVLIK
ncbi:MAG: hypothetical protein OEY59_02660 [Deltaproteobacteria bacterium]|nr:hypothetical protein [Deltaproteobacteria bacterium]